MCNLRYKKFASLEVPPGTHIISVRAPNAFSTGNEVRLPVKVEVNKTAYVSVIWSFHVGIMYQEIKEFEAKLMIRGLIREECH